jgi:hypothetical protein
LNKVVEQLNNIHPYVSGIQANFIFGLDVDMGEEPIKLTKEFASRVPYVMPNFNIPVPFGNTPLYEKYRNENRLLTAMPFSFYYMPYLVFVLKNYDAPTFYKKLIELISFVSSGTMLVQRLKSSPTTFSAGYNFVKALGNRQMIGRLNEILTLLNTDAQFRAFHDHKTDILPEFYHRQYERLLGPYSGLISREERKPLLVGKINEEVTAVPQRSVIGIPARRNVSLSP